MSELDKENYVEIAGACKLIYFFIYLFYFLRSNNRVVFLLNVIVSLTNFYKGFKTFSINDSLFNITILSDKL